MSVAQCLFENLSLRTPITSSSGSMPKYLLTFEYRYVSFDIAPNILNNMLLMVFLHSVLSWVKSTASCQLVKPFSGRPYLTHLSAKVSMLRQIFIARQYTDARYWYSKSVCPSFRPSVTFRYQMKRLNISVTFRDLTLLDIANLCPAVLIMNFLFVWCVVLHAACWSILDRCIVHM